MLELCTRKNLFFNLNMLLYFRTNFNKDKSDKIMKSKNYMFIWSKIFYSFFNESSKLKSKQINKSWKVSERLWQHISTTTALTMPNMVHAIWYTKFTVFDTFKYLSIVFLLQIYSLMYHVALFSLFASSVDLLFQVAIPVVQSFIIVKAFSSWTLNFANKFKNI